MTEPKGGIPIFGNPLTQKLMSELQDRGMMTGDYFDYVISIMNDNDKLLKEIRRIGVMPEIKKAGGGIVSLNQMTRPIGYR